MKRYHELESAPYDLDAYQFFRRHGYGADTSLALARAEEHASEFEWRVEWLGSEDPWDGDLPAPSEVLDAILRDASGDIVGSLGMIGDPDRDYGRIVEAELALEAWCQAMEATEREQALERSCNAACAL